jgi:hypothetical protein
MKMRPANSAIGSHPSSLNVRFSEDDFFFAEVTSVPLSKSLTPRLTGAGARSAQGTNTGHENGEAMASVGVRVEPPVSHLPSHMQFQ